MQSNNHVDHTLPSTELSRCDESARYVFDDRPYVSFENQDVRELAQTDPRGFLGKYRGGAVFDEVQRCPELLSYLQQVIDESQKPGRYILTGSQQFGLLSGITQSLAGNRAAHPMLICGGRESVLQSGIRIASWWGNDYLHSS